jgi:hypothetical protein
MEEKVSSSAMVSDRRFAPDEKPHAGQFDGTSMTEWDPTKDAQC